MIEFRSVTLSDKPLFEEKLKASPSAQLIDCFPAFYLWRKVLRVRYALIGGSLVCSTGEGSDTRFFYPFGSSAFLAVHRELKEYCRQNDLPLIYTKVRTEQAAEIARHYPEADIVSVRDHFEYLYLADRFRTYAGKKLQPKRNFVNFAKKNYRWEYGPLTGADTAECLRFASGFSGDETFRIDNGALEEALKNMDTLGLQGGVIRIDRTVKALFIASATGDGKTAAGLFLRADHDLKGIIPLLYQEFFLSRPGYERFNLAEDLGLEGLRKNKLSYVPERLLELHEVRI